MTADEFVSRLQEAVSRTGLTASDLARWFDRPRPTVRTWIIGEAKPGTTKGEVWSGLVQRLIWLERTPALPLTGDRASLRNRKAALEQVMDNERLRTARPSPPEPVAPASPDFNF